MTRARRWTILGAPIALLMPLAALSLAVSAPPAWAQDDGDAPHPAHIHTGSCDDLGDIVAPLGDVTEVTAGEVFGAAAAIPVKESETDVELSLGDILAAPHAVNIHESAEAIQIYIACGDIGGRVVDGELLIGLSEIDGSGYSGVAVLADNDDQTGVTVYLADEGTGAEAEPADAAPDAAATTAPAETAETAETAEATVAPPAEPTAAPADEAAAGQEAPVDIRDFAFGPNPVEIAVGDTVTWTNQDEVPHTATAEDRGVMQSGAISPGSSFSQVFEQAGEFPYFCEFHPNMTGSIVVE